MKFLEGFLHQVSSLNWFLLRRSTLFYKETKINCPTAGMAEVEQTKLYFLCLNACFSACPHFSINTMWVFQCFVATSEEFGNLQLKNQCNTLTHCLSTTDIKPFNHQGFNILLIQISTAWYSLLITYTILSSHLFINLWVMEDLLLEDKCNWVCRDTTLREHQ